MGERRDKYMCLIRSPSFLKHFAFLVQQKQGYSSLNNFHFSPGYSPPSCLHLSSGQQNVGRNDLCHFHDSLLSWLSDIQYIGSNYCLVFRLQNIKGNFGCAGKGMNILHTWTHEISYLPFLGERKSHFLFMQYTNACW